MLVIEKHPEGVKRMKKYIYVLLLTGLIFRIAISFRTYSGDVSNHIIWGKDAVDQGLQGLYERNFEKLYGHTSPNYPPLTILIFAFLYLIKNWIYQIAWFLNLRFPIFPSNLIFLLKEFDYYPYLLKLPAIFADIGIAYISYLFLNKIRVKNQVTNKLITLFILFNPAYFYNSAYWGQTDSIPLFFLLVSFYILIYQKKFLTSAILFTLGLLSKQTIIIFIPLYLIVLFHLSNLSRHSDPELVEGEESSDPPAGGKRKLRFGMSNVPSLDFSVTSFLRNDSLRSFIIVSLVTFIIFWLFFLPFYQNGNPLLFPLTTYLNKIILVSGLPFTSNHAFNFWYLLTGSRTTLASSKFIFNISYEILGYLVTGIISFLILFRLCIRSQNNYIRNFFYAGFLIPLTSFIFLTKIHERHLIVTLPFLLLLTINNKFLLVTYIYISLFNFLNMYHNWWSPNFFYLQKLLSTDFVINVLTIGLLIFYVLLLLRFFKSESKNY